MRILLETSDPDREKRYRSAAEKLGVQQFCSLHHDAQVLERLFRDPFETLIVDDAEHNACWLHMKDKPHCKSIILLFRNAESIDLLPESVTFGFYQDRQPIDVLRRIESFELSKRPMPDPETVISKRLQQTGVPVHMKGFCLLKESIRLLLAIDKPTQVRMMEDVYELLSDTMQLNASTAEHAMRHAIETAFLRADVHDLETMFGYTVSSDRAAPSNAGFLFLLADRIRSEYRRGNYDN